MAENKEKNLNGLRRKIEIYDKRRGERRLPRHFFPGKLMDSGAIRRGVGPAGGIVHDWGSWGVVVMEGRSAEFCGRGICGRGWCSGDSAFYNHYVALGRI